MLYPSCDQLLKCIPSRFALVKATAKRAKQLNNGAQRLVDSKSNKPVTIALQEIYQGKIKIHLHEDPEQELCNPELA